MDKQYLLQQAIEITKEHARSSRPREVDVVLQNVYEMLKKLVEDVRK